MQPGTLGSHFTRDLKADPELAAAYKGAIGREAKAAFREEWCKKKLAIAEKKVAINKEQRHELSDKITGTYKPFRKLWEAEGLDKEGYMAIRVETRNAFAKVCATLRATAVTDQLSPALGTEGCSSKTLVCISNMGIKRCMAVGFIGYMQMYAHTGRFNLRW
jgi:hypothetical protein